MENNYIIKSAPYSFSCPIYGDTVKQGDDCVEQEGALFCMKILEERKLGPVNPHPQLKTIRRNSVSWDNLQMRLELETIAMDPDGEDARKILDKYRRKIKAREERFIAPQN
jgi:hypothetical protein